MTVDMVTGRNRRMGSMISRRIEWTIGLVLAAVAAVEIAARITRFVHNQRVRVPEDTLSVTVAGSGPPVLFLHGFRGSGRYWQPQIRALTAQHQIIIVDLLGFGRSPWPAHSSYSVDEHIRAIHRTVKPLLRGRPVALVGHSAGAILAAEYARRYADQVSDLVLLDAPMFRTPAEARLRIREMSPMAAMFSVQRFWARAGCDLLCAFRPFLYRVAPLLDPDIPAEVARDAVLHRWESFDRTLRQVVLQSNLEEALRASAPLPVTILQGIDDHITDRSRLAAISAEVGAKLEFLPGDHNMYLRHPQATVERIAEALQHRGR